MSIELVLAMVGAFGTIALSINAFFLRGIYTKQVEIELKVTRLIVKEEDKEKRIDRLEEFEEKARERLHKLEGVLPSVQKYLE